MENRGYDSDTEMSPMPQNVQQTQELESFEENSASEDLEDSDLDRSEDWESVEDGYDSSDTDDLDFLFFRDDSDEHSDDSSMVDDDDDRFYEMLTHHIEALSHLAPTFFGLTLQMIYERIIGSLEMDEDKRKPASQQVLDSLERININDQHIECSASCCVCFVDYIRDEEVIRLPCQHFYHTDCIFNWLKITSTCPTCRGEVKEVHRDLNVNDIQGHFNSETIRVAQRTSLRNSSPTTPPCNRHDNNSYNSDSNIGINNDPIKQSDESAILQNSHAEGLSNIQVESKRRTEETGKTRRETEIW